IRRSPTLGFRSPTPRTTVGVGGRNTKQPSELRADADERRVAAERDRGRDAGGGTAKPLGDFTPALLADLGNERELSLDDADRGNRQERVAAHVEQSVPGAEDGVVVLVPQAVGL